MLILGYLLIILGIFSAGKTRGYLKCVEMRDAYEELEGLTGRSQKSIMITITIIQALIIVLGMILVYNNA